MPSFTIGLDRAGPDERAHATEAAHAWDRADDGHDEPLRDRRGVPRADPWPPRGRCWTPRARAAPTGRGGPAQGYKVVLTGEGADEALAGYVWFKTQKVRDRIATLFGVRSPLLTRKLMLRPRSAADPALARPAAPSAAPGPPSRTCTS